MHPPSTLPIRLLKSLCMGALTVALVGPVLAQIANNKPISLMVPYPAGGPSDAMARAFTTSFAREIGQLVLVENLGGVSGALAAQKVLSAPPDGHYVFQGSPNEVILAPLANAAVKLKSEDFRLIHLMGDVVMVIAARRDLAANSMDELLALARRTPGAPLSYGSNGIGTLNHLIAEDIQQRSGVQFTHAPYKGNAPLMQDLGGGQIDFAVVVYSAALGAMADQGRIKLLGQFGEKRSELLPELARVSEGSELKNFSYRQWTGFMVPKTTPENIVQQLHLAIGKTLQQSDVRTQFAAQAAVSAKPESLEEASRFYQDEINRLRSLAQKIRLQPQ